MKQAGEKANEKSRSGAGYQQNRQIVNQGKGMKKKNGNDNLCNVVGNSASHTDSEKTEIGAAKQGHDSQAECSACQAVKNTKEISKQKSDDKNTHDGHKSGFPPGIAHKDKEHAKIGKSDLDAGDSGKKRNQGFQISKDDGKGGKKSEVSSFSGHSLCGSIYLRGGRSRFSFYNDFVWEADDGASFFGDGFLLHAQMIRTIGFGHKSLPVFYYAYIGIVYGNGLILHKGVSSIFFAVHRDTDGGTWILGKKIHADP